MSAANKAEHPDALAHVLTALNGDCQVYWYNELDPPWGLVLPPSEFAYLHVLERGGGIIRLKDEGVERPVLSGDLVILPHGGGHAIADSARTSPQSLDEFIRLSRKNSFDQMRQASTRLICGKFLFENNTLNPLLPLLPTVIHIRGEGGKTDEWLESTLKLLAYEARMPRAGSKEIISRLTGVIFMHVMRSWLEQQPEARGGWFQALRDPQIAAALAAIHRDPSRPWSVATLAVEAGMSRSSFAARFTSLLGVPPLTYLNDWRLHLAAGLLKRGHLAVSQIAERTGYASETSFSKAFKRRFALAPGQYRRSSATNGEEGEKNTRSEGPSHAES